MSFCLFFEGYGLKCYTCDPTTSCVKCAIFRKEETCASRMNRCGKLVMEATTSNNESTTLYAKGWIHSSSYDDLSAWCACVSLALSPLVDVKKCEINCCSGDFCNGGKVPMVSAIMLSACALVAFLR